MQEIGLKMVEETIIKMKVTFVRLTSIYYKSSMFSNKLQEILMLVYFILLQKPSNKMTSFEVGFNMQQYRMCYLQV